jgi:hypothetical protein
MVPSFPCATRLTISVLSSHWHVSQPVLGAAAELLGLHKLVVEGGHLQGESLSLHVLTGRGGCLSSHNRQGRPALASYCNRQGYRQEHLL